MRIRTWCLVATFLAATPAAFAQFSSGSSGTDGALTITENTTIDLATQGSYDAANWAVVFNYTTIDIASGARLTFSNHPSGAPVVFLATGDVTIEGTISLNSSNGSVFGAPAVFSKPGPGGFAGGKNVKARSSGLGPGGGSVFATGNYGAGGSYGGSGGATANASAGPVYGNVEIVPLIGGSGGTNNAYYGYGGGAGGGAILIATDGKITIDGEIQANGGNAVGGAGGGGSGGAIRLLAVNGILGTGALRANSGSGGGNGGAGRIRLEGVMSFVGAKSPVPSTSSVPVVVFDSTVATLRATSINGIAIPANPDAGIETPDVYPGISAGAVTIVVEGTNLAASASVPVSVRIVPETGEVLTCTGNLTTDSYGNGTVTIGSSTPCIVPMAVPVYELQLRATW